MAIRKPFSLTAWVGSLTALFSLIAGIYGGWAFVSGQIEKHRTVNRLLAAEREQLRRSDYEPAWNTLAQAAAIDAKSARVQQAQEDVAMQWLDHISTSGDETFASITEKLEPILTRGATSAKSPQRQADLLAHIGWSYFLRGREVPSSPDPEPVYRDALLKDAANPYAHAMWGHWILWNHQGLAKADEQFAAALAAPRPALRPYVRSMQLSALQNEGSLESAEEIIRVANDMRKEHADLDPHWPHAILNIYSAYIVSPNEHKAAFLSAVSPADHLDTFDWLARMNGADDSLANAYIRSVLLEDAGRHDEALAGYRALLGRFHAGESTLADQIRKAIVRLGGAR
jgi:tetratricopeptide (TPR) repeat protein